MTARALVWVALLIGCTSRAPDVGTAPVDAAIDMAVAAPVCTRGTKKTVVPTTCNGTTARCAKRFDQVSMVMTHNAMSNADDKWAAPNQTHGLARQLTDGVRGMMLDTHYYDEETGQTLSERLPGVPAVKQAYLCHGVCQLGRRPLLEGLCDVTKFLDENRGEVLAIIFESGITPADTEAVVTASGLVEYVHVQKKGAPWPTLSEMIATDKRLVVLTESDGGSPAWYHPAWEHVFDTPYSFKTQKDFSCSLNRGEKSNALFLLNHWLGNPISEAKWAREVNVKSVLQPRIEQCTKETGRVPNFVGVDFYEIGDALSVVAAMNE